MSDGELSPAGSQRVAVVVPAYNEAPNLPRLYARLSRVAENLPRYEFEFLFVDDGSTDETPELLAELRSRDARVKALRLSRNFGSQAACLAGLMHGSGEFTAVIAADLQDPPEVLHDMLKRIQAGADAVFAYREQREDPWLKVRVSNLFHRLMRRMAIPNWPAQGADVVVLRRPVVEVLARWRQKNTALFAQMVWTGFRQEFIPYTKEKRRAGHSKHNLTQKIKVAVDSFASFSFAPIRFISYAGMLVSAAGLGFAVFIVYNRLVNQATTDGWASVMVALLVLGGLQLLMVGLLGEYLWRVADEVRGAPPFVIQSGLGMSSGETAGGWSVWREAGPDASRPHSQMGEERRGLP